MSGYQQDHGCDCEHHHHDQNKNPNIRIHTHDNAVIGSFSCQIPGTYDEAMDDLKYRLKHVAEDVRDAGGMIGHIKALAAEQSNGSFVSLTGTGGVQVKKTAVSGIRVDGVAIVLQISQEELRDILEEMF